jgi:hypothetical protein
MKRLVGIVFVIVLLMFFSVFVFKMLLDRPLFEATKEVDVYLDGLIDDGYKHIFKNNHIYISSDYLMDNELLDYYWDKDYQIIEIH